MITQKHTFEPAADSQMTVAELRRKVELAAKGVKLAAKCQTQLESTDDVQSALLPVHMCSFMHIRVYKESFKDLYSCFKEFNTRT